MNKMGYVAILMLVSTAVMAQKSLDDEVSSELDQMYKQSHVQAPAQRAQQPSAVQVNVQQAPAVQQQEAVVQKQPTTIIEASPMTESRVERMRKARQDSELQTEQKIVEKLELSRIEDERRRSEVLFGDKFAQLSNQQQMQAQQPLPQPVAAAPVAPVQQQPQYIMVQPVPPAQEQVVKTPEEQQQGEKLDREAIHEEVSAALAEAKEKDADKKTSKTYVSLLGGMGLYNNSNIQGKYAVGVGIGQKINEHWLVEAQFDYSDYQVQLPYSAVSGYYYYPTYQPIFTDMKQYQGVFEVKYALFSGSFRPVIGAATAYSYRVYNASNQGYYNFGGTSNAIDAGPLLGADFEFSEGFAIGLEGRYMMNLYNQAQGNNGLATYSENTNTPENLGYWVMGLTGRLSF